MLALTFGTAADRERALESIRAIHRRVHGQLPRAVGPFPAGMAYSAEDPALLLWVHATLLESLPLVHGLLVAPLSDEELNRYCAETASAAVALGTSDADVPRVWPALSRYLERVRASGVLVVSPQALELSAAVLAPPLAWLTGPMSWANRLVTVGLLPADLRYQYGFTWTSTHERRLNRTLAILRQVRRRLPPSVALWPEARTQSAG
jgi:uncharacterized protein (DUF2236 family)